MIRCLIALVVFCCCATSGQTQPKLSQQLSSTAMKLWPDSFLIGTDKAAKWRYDQGVILKGIESVWTATGDPKWFEYIRKSMDFYVGEDGSIKGYKAAEYNIDHINNGKVLLMLYKVTGKEKYRKAAALLRQQLATHPRTSEGGFWHKKIYPLQMWLDGLYMAQPFYAEYAELFGEDTTFNDIARQFILMEKNALDKKTGLLYHGWDESRVQRWANPTTGQSPHFWGRSLGWFGMALVDVLDYFPKDHPRHKDLVAILKRFAAATINVQDKQTGLWYDIPDRPTAKGNYPEASASCMIAYTYAKGRRQGFLDEKYSKAAGKAYDGIIKKFITTGEGGQMDLQGTVAVSGLGGNPYRDGSYEYYLSEPVIANDPKGLGAFIKCAAELEKAMEAGHGKGKSVLLDNYFNNEIRKIPGNDSLSWHYTWNDRSNGGYHVLGNIFETYGARLATLKGRPTKAALNRHSIYIIVDPDTDKESATPAYPNQQDIQVIADWVKEGGTLVLLGNDSINAEFEHFNKLAGRFRAQFNYDSRNRVINDQYEQGKVITPDDHLIFGQSKKIFVKEYSSLKLTGKVQNVIQQDGLTVMAVLKHGKGTIFVMGDPWIYNEYLDGRRLTPDFENYPAAVEWVKWLLKVSNKPKLK